VGNGKRPAREKEIFMNRNTFIVVGIALVFSLGGCGTLDETDNDDAIKNSSVIVRRIDARGDEAVRIYIDGKSAGRLTHGGIGSYSLPDGSHSIYANYGGDDDRAYSRRRGCDYRKHRQRRKPAKVKSVGCKDGKNSGDVVGKIRVV
jgi:hypothetical protein